MSPRKIIKKILYRINKNPLSKSIYNKEISKRSKLSLFDIIPLSKDINMFSPFTNELHPVNDWYGHARNFKIYMGLPQNYQFKFVNEHGVFLTDQVAQTELETDLPSFVTYSNYRVKILQKYKQHVFKIGPFIHYAPHFYSKEKHALEKKRLGKNILLFPGHSLKSLIQKYNNDWFMNKVKKIAKDFDTVRVSLYWIDIQLGLHKYYQDLGFECVTSGHILDPNFESRLKSLIEISDLTISNDAGTHVGYSVYMNKPHIIFHKFPKLNTNLKRERLTLDFWASKPYLETIEAFSKVKYSISASQRKLVHRYFGSKEDTKTKEQFKKIVNLSEKIYQQSNGRY